MPSDFQDEYSPKYIIFIYNTIIRRNKNYISFIIQNSFVRVGTRKVYRFGYIIIRTYLVLYRYGTVPLYCNQTVTGREQVLRKRILCAHENYVDPLTGLAQATLVPRVFPSLYKSLPRYESLFMYESLSLTSGSPTSQTVDFVDLTSRARCGFSTRTTLYN
ncbi:hypothetical protein NEUTE1DRAFT_109624 [Neurospora tetrasperma FGSC 2508]|uniref:Uncharacterized protein n=1 Tax=Neurospora tetrasperma (strain FGSC 2508 / ATCC MYA-4615 / P0657) TaxID=510951 RepID=F8MK88_NEUT8|nr:uncharacterized protein NEUTE1DRAFT_109624 [Neurospora tetrasperma FGSC 2508]EGO57372.1 hypothetical protein NEUTE1DRAFT_109624 [Neurospora tetrasperma FGSC 2508]